MTAIAVVLLVLGFLFATLQYPALMRRFWKWTLIGGASAILVTAAIMAAVIMNEPKPNKPRDQNPFDQFDGKPNDWVSPDAKLPDGFTLDKQPQTQQNPFAHLIPKQPQAQHGPWEDFAPNKDQPTIVKPEYYGADGRKIAKPENPHVTLEDRIDQALARAQSDR
jgi:hypothetical protein